MLRNWSLWLSSQVADVVIEAKALWQYGVAGVIGSFFTVVGMAEIITFWPGLRPLRNCCKINDRIWPNIIGFLATLIMTTETGLQCP